MSKNVAVIGCGGINSWFVKYLNDVLKLFDKRELTYVKLFDNDEVEEKNLKRGNQNFQVEHLMEQKAEVLGKEYNFDYEVTFITEENIDEVLNPFTDVILGVDNNKTRRLVYDYCLKKKKYLLDMRAQGTQMMFVVVDGKKEIEYYDEHYFANKDVMERKGSCQLEADITSDHIENANKVIAYFGAYCIFFKRLRDEDVAVKEFKLAY
jgi:molybdopterin/thiamine biosynthesis adenylyltransferase